MKLQITARGTAALDDALRRATEKKLGKLEKFFGSDAASATVTFREIRSTKMVEIMIVYGGTYFRAEEKDLSFRNALDRAVEVIERQIRKNKTRLARRLRGQGVSMQLPDDPQEYEYDEEGEFEIRTKSFAVKPMSPEEAVLQMNLLGHAFFLFRDDRTGQICAVYKRHDNTYGLIIPE